jgi:signal transduction histidine kinase
VAGGEKAACHGLRMVRVCHRPAIKHATGSSIFERQPSESDVAPAIARAGEELKLFARSAVAFRIIVTGVPRLLISAVADDVYRIAREALTNAARHAQASVVEVEIAYDVADFRLRVRDNGKGLEPSVQTAGAGRFILAFRVCANGRRKWAGSSIYGQRIAPALRSS